MAGYIPFPNDPRIAGLREQGKTAPAKLAGSWYDLTAANANPAGRAAAVAAAMAANKPQQTINQATTAAPGAFMQTQGYQAGQAPIQAGAVAPIGAGAQDPYLASLYSLLGQTSGGSSPDLSGYNAALSANAQERKRMNKRYNTYNAQIGDIFGNLTRKSEALPAEITAASEMTRAQTGAQQQQYANQTRSVEDARLAAANAARQGLGLDTLAAQGAGGDAVTAQSEAGLQDKAALGQTTIDTILANEAAAKQQAALQTAGYGTAEASAKNQLSTSLENALAALKAQDVQTKIARGQAASTATGPSGPSLSDQMNILNAAQAYKEKQAGGTTTASTEPATKWFQENPNLQNSGTKFLGAFLPWFNSDAPTVSVSGKGTPTIQEYIQAFKKVNPHAAQLFTNHPQLRQLLSTTLNLK